MTSYSSVPTQYDSEVLSSPYSDLDSSYLKSNYFSISAETAAGKAMEPDGNTLAKLLSPVSLPEYASIADQIFGSQAQRQKLSLEHILNLMNERSILHKRHLTEIQRRHMDVHAQFEGSKRNWRLDNHRLESQLRSTLIQLDEQRHREELQFWKDTKDLREKLFETAEEYQAGRHRASLLEGTELGGGAYDG